MICIEFFILKKSAEKFDFLRPEWKKYRLSS